MRKPSKEICVYIGKVLILLGIITVVHELGHYLAMVYFGYSPEFRLMFFPVPGIAIGLSDLEIVIPVWQQFIISSASLLEFVTYPLWKIWLRKDDVKLFVNLWGIYAIAEISFYTTPKPYRNLFTLVGVSICVIGYIVLTVRDKRKNKK